VDYWLAAGRQAWRRSATAEAVALLRRGLALVPGLDDTDQRREAELDLRIALGQALIMSWSWAAPELGEVYSRAQELASALNRPRALLFPLWGQFMDHWARADLKRARRLAVELSEHGDTAGDVPMQVMGCSAGGLACCFLGEFAAGWAYAERGLALYDPAQRPSYSELLSYDARVQLRFFSCWLLASLGHFDQALSQRDAALDEARRLSHPPTLAVALDAAWWTGWFVRLEPRSLLQYADEMLALATEHEIGFYRMVALNRRGWSLAALGRADEGIPQLTAGLAGWDQVGLMVGKLFEKALLGDACRMAGQLQLALGHLVEARRLTEETEDRWGQAEALRLIGDVLAAMGDGTGAETSYSEAIAIAQQQNARFWELRAAMSLARLWREQGKRSEARDLLGAVYGWFTEGFGTPVLQEAKALLDELSPDHTVGMGDDVAPSPASSRTAVYDSA
jgi:tetratricopeptide (TPR) repeat protein